MTEHSLWRFSRAIHHALNERQTDQLEDMLDDNVDWAIYGPIDMFAFLGARRGKKAVIDVIKQIADFWVTTQLLNAEAVKRNVTASPKTEFMVQLRTMQVYGGEVIQQVQETATATEADVNDYYSKNKD